MKNIIFFLALLHSAITSVAQDGFKIIQKAEHKYNTGKYKAALKLLDEAEKKDYGFCGNAWMDANRAIYMLRVNIYTETQQYQNARNSLDSLRYESRYDNFDSIRITTYQKEFGIDSLRNMIDSSLHHVSMDCWDYQCFVSIRLTNGTEMRLKVNAMFSDYILYETDEKKRVERWLTWFKESENYKLIKGEE